MKKSKSEWNIIDSGVALKVGELDLSVVESVRIEDSHRVFSISETWKSNPELIEPIKVLSDYVTVVDGLHRVKAASFAGILEIKADVLDISPDDPKRWLAVISYNRLSSPKPLSVTEVSSCLRSFLKESGDVEDLWESFKDRFMEWGVTKTMVKEAVGAAKYMATVARRGPVTREEGKAPPQIPELKQKPTEIVAARDTVQEPPDEEREARLLMEHVLRLAGRLSGLDLSYVAGNVVEVAKESGNVARLSASVAKIKEFMLCLESVL